MLVIIYKHLKEGGGIETQIMNDVRRTEARIKQQDIFKEIERYYQNEIANKGSFNDNMTVIYDFSIKQEQGNLKGGDIFETGHYATAGQIRVKPNGEIRIIQTMIIDDFYCGYDKSSSTFELKEHDCQIRENKIRLSE